MSKSYSKVLKPLIGKDQGNKIEGGAMTKSQLRKKIAKLETINDFLLTEVCYVDDLMRLVGFTEGLKGVKATAEELINKGYVENLRDIN